MKLSQLIMLAAALALVLFDFGGSDPDDVTPSGHAAVALQAIADYRAGLAETMTDAAEKVTAGELSTMDELQTYTFTGTDRARLDAFAAFDAHNNKVLGSGELDRDDAVELLRAYAEAWSR